MTGGTAAFVRHRTEHEVSTLLTIVTAFQFAAGLSALGSAIQARHHFAMTANPGKSLNSAVFRESMPINTSFEQVLSRTGILCLMFAKYLPGPYLRLPQ
jgi:hypothetical protein